MLVKEYEGGLKALEIEFINAKIKINWLKSFLKNEKSFWFYFIAKLSISIISVPIVSLYGAVDTLYLGTHLYSTKNGWRNEYGLS